MNHDPRDLHRIVQQARAVAPPEQIMVNLKQPDGSLVTVPWQLAVVNLLSGLQAQLAELLAEVRAQYDAKRGE